MTRKPTLRKQPIAWHLFDVTVLSQVQQGLDVPRLVRKVVGRPRAGANLLDGGVAESSFFVPRDITQLTPEAIERGPTEPGQRPTPPYHITKMKDEGKTAGVFVTDARGQRYLFKLDVVGSPELITGAEVVTSKLLHALGYYVPSYEIVEVAADEFTISPKLSMTTEAFQALWTRRGAGERLRASASRIIEGDILGRIRFKQFRDCTELRALRLAYAWVNNTDAKDHNSLMVWTGDRVLGYLIDFGSSLGGEAEGGPKHPCQGWVYDVDLSEMTLELLTLGLRQSGCDPREKSWSPAVGLFSPRLDPERWKPYAPNLAFEEMTEADAHWMAARLATFSTEQLEAAVSAGRYQDPRDAARLVEVLQARRRAMLDRYLDDDR